MGERLQVWLASRETPEANKQAMVDFCLLRRDFAQLLGRLPTCLLRLLSHTKNDITSENNPQFVIWCACLQNTSYAWASF